MKLHEALNILANADTYGQYNLASPSFNEGSDGTLIVSFRAARADGMSWGMRHFESAEQLTYYIAGMDAARREAAFDAPRPASPATAE